MKDKTMIDVSRSSGGVPLHVHDLGKSFGSRQVLKHTTLNIAAGEFVAIVGRSGCGKSTLLRLVAGLDAPSQGKIQIDQDPVQGLQSETRIMFQEARLLPWRRVVDNVALGLPDAQRERSIEVLEQVGLGDRLNDWPAKLSGGQRQRVALARALVHQPRLLLLDEPLGALDALTRIEMHALIERLWLTHGFTALLVTHDVQEAVALADRVILIEDGTIAFDVRVPLSRPRHRGDPEFAAFEQHILDRVLKPSGSTPSKPPQAPRTDHRPARPPQGLRWAV